MALYNATGGPNMDFNLIRIVEQFQTGQFTALALAANAPIHREESVAVTLYVTEGYAQDVWDWLEEYGAEPRNIGTRLHRSVCACAAAAPSVRARRGHDD